MIARVTFLNNKKADKSYIERMITKKTSTNDVSYTEKTLRQAKTTCI